MQQADRKQKKVSARRGAYHHGDLRASLVEATRQLVEEKGPDRFSVSDACRLAGVSTAAPYRHFSDREEMLFAVTMDGMDRFYEVMRDAVEGLPRGSAEAIFALGRAYVDFAAAEPGVFRLIFGLAQRQGKSDDVRERGMRVYGVLLDQVAGHYGYDDINQDVQARAFSLWTFVHGLSFLLIDEKTSQMEIDVNLDEVIGTASRRMLA
ncbi:MAG: TetR/AcrR family transcriptional regulator [Pseudomonadota bacterium]